MEETGFECPKCGANLMENKYLFFCEKEKNEEDKCDFKIWKNSKLLNDEIDTLIFSQMNSAEGYEFDRGILRIDPTQPYFTKVEWKDNGGGYSKGDVKLEFHLHEFTGKNGDTYKVWKEEIEDASQDRERKTVFQTFCQYDITEEEAKKLFNNETVHFENLTSKAGKPFKANGTLEYNSEKQNWNIKLVFED